MGANNETVLVSGWEDLVGMENENFRIEVDLHCENAWIRSKVDNMDYYLSTHTFYESTYAHSTRILQDHGFNVELVSWG